MKVPWMTPCPKPISVDHSLLQKCWGGQSIFLHRDEICSLFEHVMKRGNLLFVQRLFFVLFSTLAVVVTSQTLSFDQQLKPSAAYDFFYQSVTPIDQYNAFLYAVIEEPSEMAGVYFRT